MTTTTRSAEAGSRLGFLAVLILWGTNGTNCLAAMLNLVPQAAYPTDITASFTSATYDATTLLFTITGTATAIDYDGSAPPDALISHGTAGQPASFKISVHVNHSGALVGAATATDLNIMGILANGTPHPSPVYGTLLSGQVLNFGYANTTPNRLFEFIFQVTGGSQQPQFGPKVGVVFDSISGFNGSFSTNFTTTFTGNADNFGVPEPSTGVLLVLGLVGSAAIVRRSARNKRVVG